MGIRILLGVAVGGIVSLLSWNGNRTPHSVSTFPDLLTLFALVVLTCCAVYICIRQSEMKSTFTFWKTGITIGATAGLVFGIVLVFLSTAHFGHYDILLSTAGFLSAFVSSIACGVAASVLVPRLVRKGGRNTA